MQKTVIEKNILPPSREQGFTLIELSMVLVVMGLILGMVFKGKSVLEQAKNKSVQTQLHKIQLSVESFRQQYGHWPGDGCTDDTATQCNGNKNGLLDQKTEQAAFWAVLIRHHLLNEQDRQHAFGKPWQVVLLGNSLSDTVHQLTTSLPITQACILDRQMDDGMATTGALQMKGQTYQGQTECQALSGEGALEVSL